ncbi:MAG TPA: HAD family phosphatase [Blastocatellia bacterium]|nr:HAD family phosphatase [Blastocatellia bacterium]
MGRRPSIAAVILDMDGLMLDTESIYKKSWQKAAAECGYMLDDDFYLTLVGQPNPACEAALLNRFGSEFPMADFRAHWSGLWRTEVETSGIPTKAGLSDLLSYLREHQVRVAVATSSDRDYTSLSLRAAGLEMPFDQIVTGDQVARGKPSPDIYLESARRLGVAPVHCIAIEDSDAGVLAASAAGMTTVMVPDLKAPSPQAREAAYCVVASLVEAREEIASLMMNARGSG